MGTDYILHNSDKVEIIISEMSNKLTLEIWKDDADFNTEEMLPKEMLKMFLEGIKNVSYYMDKKEFNEIMSTMENYSV